jgi:single-stranded-DNA-specific exonuclease
LSLGPDRQWSLNPAGIDAERILSRELGIGPLTARILSARCLGDLDTASGLLRTSLTDLPDPFLMRGMGRAVERLAEARRGAEAVLVYGDYDVDGMTSAACLTLLCRSMGIPTRTEVQKRRGGSHGLSAAAVDQAAQEGRRVLFTADCGTSNVEEVQYARSKGIDVIVVDHHQPGAQLPAAHTVLNPAQAGCAYPFKQLCAVGVAFTFVRAATQRLSLPDPLDAYLDLVALGTVADAVPLAGDNRILVRAGLQELGRRHRPGIAALIDRSQLEGAISARAVGYRLAPRLNAAGRVGHADQCVELLLTDSYAKAVSLAKGLDDDNTERQRQERQMLETAMPKAHAAAEDGHQVIIVDGGSWPDALLGVVASRLKERFRLPVVTVASNMETGLARMSLRAPKGVDLVAALQGLEDQLLTHGGHAAAAGLSVEIGSIDAVKDILFRRLSTQMESSPLSPLLSVDTEVHLSEFDERFLDELSLLGPFGTGYPEPILVARGVRPLKRRVVGGEHLRVQLSQGSTVQDAIGFSMAQHRERLKTRTVDALLTPRLTSWRGRRKLELQLVDVQRSAQDGAART